MRITRFSQPSIASTELDRLETRRGSKKSTPMPSIPEGSPLRLPSTSTSMPGRVSIERLPRTPSAPLEVDTLRPAAPSPTPSYSAPEVAAQAYKQAHPELTAIYSGPPAEPDVIKKKPKTVLASLLTGFSKLRNKARRADPPDPVERFGVFVQPRNMNRDSRSAKAAERPGKVRPWAASTSQGVTGTVEVVHARHRSAALPPVIPAMDFQAVSHEMKREDRLDEPLRRQLQTQREVNSRLGEFRNRFPEPDPVADTQRLRRALTAPGAALDDRGAFVPPPSSRATHILSKLSRLTAPASHPKIMGRVHRLDRQQRGGLAPTHTAESALPQQLHAQQNRLMAQLNAQEEVRIARIACLRTGAYIAKAERNLVDAHQTLLGVRNLATGTRVRAAREAAALNVVCAPGAMPTPDALRAAGLSEMVPLAQHVAQLRELEARLSETDNVREALERPGSSTTGAALGNAAARLQGIEVTHDQVEEHRRLVDEAMAQLSPQTVSRYIHHLADTLFSDLFELRRAASVFHDTATQAGDPLMQALARLEDPDARTALRDIAGLNRQLHDQLDQATERVHTLGENMELARAGFVSATQRTAEHERDPASQLSPDASAEARAAHTAQTEQLHAAKDAARQRATHAGRDLQAATTHMQWLQQATAIASRVGRMPMIERAAAAYFEAVRSHTQQPAASVGDRGVALRETAAQNVTQIETDLAAMRSHLAAQQTHAATLEEALLTIIAQRADAERHHVEGMLEAPAEHGFRAETVTPESIAHLRGALMPVYDRIAAQPQGGLRASSPAMVVSGAINALSLATGGDTALAGRIVDHLAGMDLVALARPLDRQDGVEAAALRTAVVLAQVPRGIEILQQLTGGTETPFVQGAHPPDPKMQAVKIFLKAQATYEDPPKWNDAVRAQVANFRRLAGEAAALAAAADDPRSALAQHATVAQRAAYHAMRNGMDNNAPGSDYDKANQAMAELSGWLQNLDGPYRREIAPFVALDQVVRVMDATGNPTLRRVHEQSLRNANDHLLTLVQRGMRQAPTSFERAALEALLQEIAAQPENSGVAKLVIDRPMLGRAEAAARAQGLHPSALEANSTPTDLADRIAAESLFDGLLERALHEGHVSGADVLEAIHAAMTQAGVAGDEAGFNPDQVRHFLAEREAAHPQSPGSRAMAGLFEEALLVQDGPIDSKQLLTEALIALPHRVELDAAEVEALPEGARTVHRMVERLHELDHRLSGMDVLRTLAHEFAPLEDPHDDAQVLDALPTTRSALESLCHALPDQPTLRIAKALTDSLADKATHDPSALARSLEGGSDLALAAWHGHASMRGLTDAETAFQAIWTQAQTEATSAAHWLSGAVPHMAALHARTAHPQAEAFQTAMALAEEQSRIEQAPPPANADELLDKLSHTLANMTWRDRTRMSIAHTLGLNTDRLFSVPTPVPFLSVQGKVIVGLDARREAVFESFMSSPAGPQVVFGIRRAYAGEGGLGAGVTFGTKLVNGETSDAGTAQLNGETVTVTKKAPDVRGNVRIYAEARGRGERSTEHGVSLRIPRYLGRESALHDQFKSLVNDLFRVARNGGPAADGTPPDLFGELLAAQPDASLGPQRVRRSSTSVEGMAEGGASVSLGGLLGSIGLNGGIQGRRDATRSKTQPTAHIHWPAADSSIANRVSAQGNVGWSPLPIVSARTELTQTDEQAAANEASSTTTETFRLAGIPVGINLSTELVTGLDRRLDEQTYFDGEHFYDWAARGHETTDMAMFRDSTLGRLSQWAELAAIRAPRDIPDEDRYALGEKFVLDLLSQASAIGKRNSTTTATSFDILLQELDPQVDHLHREAWFAARRNDKPTHDVTQALLEQVFNDPHARKVALLHVSNTTRETARLGINYFLKAQATYTGESRKTMIQIPQANPIVDGPRTGPWPRPSGIQPAAAQTSAPNPQQPLPPAPSLSAQDVPQPDLNWPLKRSGGIYSSDTQDDNLLISGSFRMLGGSVRKSAEPKGKDGSEGIEMTKQPKNPA